MNTRPHCPSLNLDHRAAEETRSSAHRINPLAKALLAYTEP